MSELFFKRIDRILANLNQLNAYLVHPYNLNDIANAILAQTVVDEVVYHPFSQSHNGMIEGSVRVDIHEDGVYSGSKCVATIMYCKDLPLEWKNFIVCKELCQLIWVDHPYFRTSNTDELIQIANHLLEFSGRKTIAQQADCPPALTEDASFVCAMEILIPWGFRNIIMKKIQDGNVTLEEISQRFCCPVEIVKHLFTAEYHDFASRQSRVKLLK